MNDWIVCPSCHLNHRRRPDGICPRCNGHLDVPPQVPDEPPPEVPRTRYGTPVPPADLEPVVERLPVAYRIGGAVLLLNGLVALVDRFAVGAPSQTILKYAISSSVIDVGIGALLLSGDERCVFWARLRSVLGLLVLPIVFVLLGDPALAIVQAFFSLALVNLLYGVPGSARIGVSSAVFVLYFALGAIALSGRNPLGKTALSMKGEIGGTPATEIAGKEYPYRIPLPKGGAWYLRNEGVARAENPLVDRWVVRPESDAHVIVIVEQVPGAMNIPLDDLTQGVMQNLEKSLKKFRVVEQETVDGKHRCRLLHTRGVTNGIEIESYYGIYSRVDTVYQVVGAATPRTFPRIAAELKEIVTSLEMQVR
jgi:hypothetical protein